MLPATIGEEQKKDPKLQKLLKDKPNNFSTKIVEDTKLTTMNGKIYIPENLQLQTVAWYHEYLSHPGQVRTEQTLRQHFTWPGLRTDVRKVLYDMQEMSTYQETPTKVWQATCQRHGSETQEQSPRRFDWTLDSHCQWSETSIECTHHNRSSQLQVRN